MYLPQIYIEFIYFKFTFFFLFSTNPTFTYFVLRFVTITYLKAGITEKQLSIALEPETASIYCQHLQLTRQTDKGGASFLGVAETGTRFMVVDLGGKKQVTAVIVTSWSSGVCLFGFFICFFGEGWGWGLRKIFFSTNLSENLYY